MWSCSLHSSGHVYFIFVLREEWERRKAKAEESESEMERFPIPHSPFRSIKRKRINGSRRLERIGWKQCQMLISLESSRMKEED